MSSSELYIIGNGFDIAHKMPTGYGDFRQWLIDNNRIDVIQELQSAYPKKINDKYLLWSEFEKALGEYDLETVINWSMESLCLTECYVGGQTIYAPDFILNTRLPDIINDVFSRWISSVPIATTKADYNIVQDALYLSFNYTDTLEQLYQVPESNVMHIHGRASKGEKLIVGHNRMINPAEYRDDKLDFRENNERMQRLTDMNKLCKPVDDIIERNENFFKKLSGITDIHVIGHSCEKLDYPYFKKTMDSVSEDVKWLFCPYKENIEKDLKRMKLLIKEIGINPSNTTGVF